MTGKLTKSVIDKATVKQKDYFLWDSQLKGFGLKIAKGGRKSYVCKYRVGGGRNAPTRRMTIGAHGSPWTADQARSEAKLILALAATGKDPAKEKQEKRNQFTLSEFCDLYLKEGCATKKASTISTDKGRIERHIKPLLGRKKINDITKADIKRFLQDIANGKTSTDIKTCKQGRAIVTGGKGTASRTVGLLGGIFSYAIDCGHIENNPVHGVKRFKDKKAQRFLSQQELIELGNILRDAQSKGENPFAIAIIKLLIFTGARKGEIESLTWNEIDFSMGFLRLDDSKTGQKIIPLNAGTLTILTELQSYQRTDYVFPASRGTGYYSGTPKVWRRLRLLAGLQTVRLHDLRHSFASIAVSGGASLPMIGALLGHMDSATTQRYAHLSNDPVRLVTDSVGDKINSALSGQAQDTVSNISTIHKNILKNVDKA